MNRTRTCFAIMLLAVGSLNAQPERTPDPGQAGAMAKKYYLEHLAPGPAKQGGGGNSPDAITERFFTGAAAGDNFGLSVASAGDVNGDGYNDVILGAFGSTGFTGRAYIYFGGLSINTVPDVVLTGAAANDYFGYSVASAGDVNGDGYSDVIVGAYANDAGGVDAGRAYIYFGGASMNNTADVTLTGAAANDNFGQSVASAGDVNGDGYGDVIVGAYSSSAGGDLRRSSVHLLRRRNHEQHRRRYYDRCGGWRPLWHFRCERR